MSAEPLSNLVNNVVELEPKDETPAAKQERKLYALIDTSKELIGGLDVAAKVMKIDAGDLRRALNRTGRYLAIEHVMRFADRLRQHSPQVAQQIAALIMQPFELVVFPRVQLTAAERARRMQKKLEQLGAACGVDLVTAALEEP